MPRHRKDPDFDPDTFFAGPSKSQLKRDSHELQDLGTALQELPEDRVAEIEMDERLREALHELKRLKNGEARRRHQQYIGKLLREADPEPFRRALAEYRQGQTQAVLNLQELERWRQRLLTEERGLDAWIQVHPHSDTPQFRALVTRARRERSEDEAEGRSGSKGPYYRELFQAVRSVLQPPAANRGKS
jgi:ribosome-associated protein